MTEEEANINLRLQDIELDKDTAGQLKTQTLDTYIAFGTQHAQLAKQIPSTKEFGKELKRRFPACEKMDPALRSNCGWLAEALNNPNHDAHDLLKVLGVTSVHELGCENPTAIRSLYRKAKKNGETN